MYPLRRKVQMGKLRWYENISIDYNINAEGKISTTDSLLFKENLGSKYRNGVKHSLKVSSGSIKILKFISWSNNINYTERWYSKRLDKVWLNENYNPNGELTGQVLTDTLNGFYGVRDFNFDHH